MAAHKSLSVATVLEKNKLSSGIPFLVCLDVDVVNPATGGLVETISIVKNTENITWNGRTYIAAAFDIELKEEAGATPTINLSIKDYTRTIAAKMEQYGGGVGFRVVVSVVRGDTATMPTDKPELQAFFEVVGASQNEYSANFTLGAESPIMKIFPRRVQSKDFCVWRYKDSVTCRYAGAMPSCDLTLSGDNGCKAHNNEKNFGAFPGITNAGTRYI